MYLGIFGIIHLAVMIIKNLNCVYEFYLKMMFHYVFATLDIVKTTMHNLVKYSIQTNKHFRKFNRCLVEI